jgi:hypothetical protein
MKRTLLKRPLSYLVAVGVAGLAVPLLARAFAAERAAAPAANPNPARGGVNLDRPKRVIERPTEALLAGGAPAAAGDKAFVNPKVQPGKVRWHADLDAACRAARASGKPVLLFHMMGRLDEKFC